MIEVKKLTTTLCVKMAKVVYNAVAVPAIMVKASSASEFMFGFIRTLGNTDVMMKIVVSDAVDGTMVVLKEKVFSSGQPATINDQVFIEALKSEVMQLATEDQVKYAFIGVQIEVADGDEGTALLIQGENSYHYDGLTSDVIA